MKPSIIKSTIVLAMALLPLFSFGQEQITKTERGCRYFFRQLECGDFAQKNVVQKAEYLAFRNH